MMNQLRALLTETAPNIAVEPTPNSLRSCVAPALGRGSPRAFGFQTHSWHKPQPGVRARFLQGVYNPNSRKATSVGRRDVVAEESTVQLELTLTLPASLAREAEDQGLLTSPMVETLLRAEVQRRRVAQLFEAADRLAALPLAPLSEDEVEAEIHAVRAERRATRARGR